MSDSHTIYNVYCDESCHLERDGEPVMVLGALWCAAEYRLAIAERIREIKEKHGLSRHFEMKWSKVSPGKADFYRDVIDYFFDNDELHLRVLVAHKEGLRNSDFGQTHDDWYYKMYYLALHSIILPRAAYFIYLDLKDTRSGARNKKLQEVLCNKIRDFNQKVIRRVQTVHSNEVEQVQLVDILIGAVGYANRSVEIRKSPAKLAIVERIEKRSGHNLHWSTLLREDKFNVFQWHPQGTLEL